MQIPMYHEGWDEIKLISNYERGRFNRWLDYFTYEYESEFINIYKKWDLLNGCIEMPQDNPHHTFSLSRHMFRTYKQLKDKGMVCFAGALHDIGKAFTKSFGEDGYAHYYNHDNISAQLSVEYMLRFTDFEIEKIIYIATLVQLHMRMFNREDLEKLYKLIGDNLYNDLQLLHNADIYAK
jgi:tRNA nucleotidyltransferase (CCA-adding enzyme)